MELAAEPDDRGDQCPPGWHKKRLGPALLNLAEGRETKEPMIQAILQAKLINRVLGGEFVAPWEVGELTSEWMDVIMGIGVQVPAMKAAKEKVEEAKERWRRKLPTYRQ